MRTFGPIFLPEEPAMMILEECKLTFKCLADAVNVALTLAL